MMHNSDILERLDFKDIYLGKDTIFPKVEPKFNQPLQDIWQYCDDLARSQNRKEFSLELNGIYYRVSTLTSLKEKVYVIRKPHPDLRLEQLHIPQIYLSRMMQENISGLLVISGSYGEGKTTTGMCLVRARLERYGGTAITIEDPPELRIEGHHGEGYCYQTDVMQGEFGQACRTIARLAPEIIYISEIRDTETATEALRASINGRLVICTTHSESVPLTLERLYALANNKVDASDDAASLLSNGLLGVFHQKLETHADEVRPRIEMLWLGGNEQEVVGVRAQIKGKRWGDVKSFMNLQQAQSLKQHEIGTRAGR